MHSNPRCSNSSPLSGRLRLQGSNRRECHLGQQFLSLLGTSPPRRAQRFGQQQQLDTACAGDDLVGRTVGVSPLETCDPPFVDTALPAVVFPPVTLGE